jgi:hypothetical protein
MEGASIPEYSHHAPEMVFIEKMRVEMGEGTKSHTWFSLGNSKVSHPRTVPRSEINALMRC